MRKAFWFEGRGRKLRDGRAVRRVEKGSMVVNIFGDVGGDLEVLQRRRLTYRECMPPEPLELANIDAMHEFPAPRIKIFPRWGQSHWGPRGQGGSVGQGWSASGLLEHEEIRFGVNRRGYFLSRFISLSGIFSSCREEIGQACACTSPQPSRKYRSFMTLSRGLRTEPTHP